MKPAWQVVDPSVYEVLTRADDFSAVTLALGQVANADSA